MEIFKPEVHALFLRPFLDEIRETLGDDKLQGLIRSFGVTESALRDPAAWVSLEFCERFCESLTAAGMDQRVFERCGRRVLTPQYLGILRPLFRTFSTPAFTYLQLAQAAPRFNKVGWTKIHERRRGHVKLEYFPIPGAPRERGELVCRARAAQLAAVPTMFDLEPAAIAHPTCMCRGGESCVYELTWQEAGGTLVSRAGFLVGALAGGALAAAAGQSLAHGLEVGALGALLLWGAGRVWELKREITRRASEIFDYKDALARSVTAHEERYVELLDTKAEVERHKQAERNFYANVSHDLRTPLTLILAPLGEELARADLPADTRAVLEVMRKNAEQLSKLIDQLLEMEKMEAGRVELNRTPADPVALVRSLEERFSAAAVARGIALEVTAPERMAPAALDGGSIESALSNLIANAFRFARGRVAVRLAERAGRDSGDGGDGASLVFEVEDDGEGIAAEDLPRIFDRFAQAGDATRRKGGTGLGLALARESARLHGGSLTVVSAPGAGATFTLSLPRMPASEAPGSFSLSALAGRGSGRGESPAASNGTAHPPRPPAPPNPNTWPGPTAHAPLVLVVEDDDDLRAFVAGVLAARYRVVAAESGDAGLEAAFRLRPDAIVSDISMPSGQLSGIDLCRQVRTREQGRRTPVLLLTARTQLEQILEGFAAGADDYVTKPFAPPELLARVDAHVLLGRLLREIAHKERLATLGMVAASVAHQVLNPLSALGNTIESLKERVEESPRTADMFELIVECMGRIEKLTHDLLDLSRVDRQDVARFRPADGIRACVRMLQARLPSQIHIETALDDGIEIEGRPGDLNHVFLNLMDNAARAVSGDGTVAVRTSSDQDQFVLEVADSGPGIPDNERDAIFEPFYSTRSAGEGTGLGLFLVKKVVGAHGGSVSVGRSELGGASFLIRVPRTRPLDGRSIDNQPQG